MIHTPNPIHHAYRSNDIANPPLLLSTGKEWHMWISHVSIHIDLQVQYSTLFLWCRIYKQEETLKMNMHVATYMHTQ